MLHDPELDHLLVESTFFPGLNARLASLPSLQRVVERQLNMGCQQEIAELRREHAHIATTLPPDDRELDLLDLEQQVTHLLPKLFRGGFILTLWSVLERSVKDISIRAGEYTDRPIPPKLFRRKPFFTAAEEALTSTVGLSAFPDCEQKAKLEFLASVRHTLIHHDGRIAEAPPNLALLDKATLEKRGLQWECEHEIIYIVPLETFVSASTSLVVQYVHNTASRVFNTLVPAPSKEN